MITYLVGNCHVGDSNLDVLRYVLRRMVGKRKTFLKLSRAQRRKLMRQIFKAHAANRKVYKQVMGGIR